LLVIDDTSFKKFVEDEVRFVGAKESEQEVSAPRPNLDLGLDSGVGIFQSDDVAITFLKFMIITNRKGI
jgi:hypothetical protein